MKDNSQLLEALEKRVKVLEDIEQVKQLHYRYLNCLIQADYDGIMECFSDNIVADIRRYLVRGKAEVEKLFRETVSLSHAGKEGDFVVHPIVSVDGDKAKGSFLLYIMYYHPKTGQSLCWVQGYYDAEYIRENGEWKFSLMKWRARIVPPHFHSPPTEATLLNFLDTCK